jgi:hypothetical protein
MLMMLGRMQGMTVRHLRMMRCRLMIAALGVLGRFAVVPGGMFMMFCSLFMMFVNFVSVHRSAPPKNSPSTKHLYGADGEVITTGWSFQNADSNGIGGKKGREVRRSVRTGFYGDISLSHLCHSFSRL